MTGPEHYAEAERLLALIADGIEDIPDEDDGTVTDGISLLAVAATQAQVHATLALSAAMVEREVGDEAPNGRPRPPGAVGYQDWDSRQSRAVAWRAVIA